MPPEVGFYSFIHYCFNENNSFLDKKSVAIGVVLFVPETGFVDVMLTEDDFSVELFCGKNKNKKLQEYKKGIPEMIKKERRKFATLDTAKRFLDSYNGFIQFSIIRSTFCTDGAEKRLKLLYMNHICLHLLCPD